jgi:hypothetical protein
MANRLVNAVTQKLYFIEEKSVDECSREYKIMGSTGNIYTVTISEALTCTCPDYKLRKVQCKHIYFVLVRVLKVKSQFINLKKMSKVDLMVLFASKLNLDGSIVISADKKEKYDKAISANTTASNETDRKKNDDICPICLDDILDLKDAYYCKQSCGKNVHIECFNMWAKSKGTICVFCRVLWSDEKTNCKYINLLN